MKYLIILGITAAIAIAGIACGLWVADTYDSSYEDDLVGRDHADFVGGMIALTGLFGSVASYIGFRFEVLGGI